jgi:hypothetical protein
VGGEGGVVMVVVVAGDGCLLCQSMQRGHSCSRLAAACCHKRKWLDDGAAEDKDWMFEFLTI